MSACRCSTGRPPVKVTPGRAGVPAEARRILRLAEESSLAVRRIPTGEGGTLTVGFTAVSVHGYVRSFLRRIVEELPHVDLVLRELVTADQVEAIASGDIDLGFVRPAGHQGGPGVPRGPGRAAAPRGAGRRPARHARLAGAVADLDGRALVMYSPVESRYFYELVLGLTVRAQVRPRYVQYVSQVHTMLALVQAGIGLAIVPESAKELHPDGVAFIALADARRRQRSSWRRRGARPSTARP